MKRAHSMYDYGNDIEKSRWTPHLLGVLIASAVVFCIVVWDIVLS